MNRLRERLDTVLALMSIIAPLVIFVTGAFSDDPRQFFNNILAIPFIVVLAAFPVAILGLFLGMFRR
ncbi:hypothetical protein [Thiolapillus sp.]